MSHRPRIVVVGGGITGLAAAWEVRDDAEVMVFEAASRVGGKVETIDFAGRRMDTGPDAFIARVPHGLRLAGELGLGGDLVSPATGEAAVWVRDRLRTLPAGLVLGVPSALRPLARSGIVSPVGVVRAALDLVLPATSVADDIGVGHLVRRRMGAQVHERLADALLGGINAGRSEDLSIDAGAPQLAAVARRSRSLLRGLARSRANAPALPGPVFRSVRGGMDRMIDRLVDGLGAAGARFALGAAVEAIEPRPGGGYRVLAAGIEHEADGVIVTVPAPVAATLLAPLAAEAASALRSIDYSSVALTLLVYPASAFPRPYTGSGYLVPRVEGRLTTAVSWTSSKWPELARPDDIVLRVSAGRWRDERALELDDDALVSALHDELMAATGGRAAAPTSAHVRRWMAGFPQYRPGHLGLADRIDASIRAAAPALEVAGAAYRGLGLPACIDQGRTAARRLVDRLTAG